MSSVQEQKEDLQKRLSYTTHKLEMLESEFDSTRQYLEAELLRAQVELEKCTEKLNRVQNSYEVLQRMNQNLEDKTQELKLQYEEEKRALSQEIIILNNHLMEAKITIEKLKEDNELYRKDCNLATQLLLCGKFNHKAHKLSELPTDFKKRVSSHIEKQGYARNKGLCDTPYSDMVPAAVIAKPVKPEPGNSCPVTHSSSPHSRDLVLTNNGIDISNTHHRHVISKSSDLYCSDTALYCPSDERPQSHWQQRRQSVDLHDRETNVPQVQNSIESHPEKGKFHSNNAVPFHGITTGSPPASSFTLASNDNCNTPSSTLSSSHLSLCRDWKEGDYNRKSTSSFDKTTPAFPKSHSVQHKATNLQKCNSPAYRRTAPCYSEPYHSPQLSSSLGMASSGFPIEAPSSFPISEEEMTGHWKQLSVEDINTLPYCSLGYVSPYCFSEQHFVMGPTAPLYSSFQEGNDNFHTHAFDPYFPTSPGSNLRPSPKHSLGLYNTEKGLMSQPNDACIGVKTSLLPQGTSKDMENTAGAGKKEVANANNSESLHKQGEATKYQNKGPQKKTHPQYQTFGTRGLSRKDSLTKAQLYGTLLN
ncbi:brain-enriched guanylate kinase-associated protein isoform X1 [Hoplias malabaricus]|uniref:brain-enriched guanylate kinase-associated protein isoform X1 n=1 Tax=Hoplias malabaricus TaxID=27720 RepID=UPI0034633EFE